MVKEKNILISYWKKEKIVKDKNILKALIDIDRANFVPFFQRKYAYVDAPLHIGENQTISQPTTVAIMTQALKPKKGDKILEVGSGSGYQSAILSKIVGKEGKIISIERIKKLYFYAKKNLKKFDNVKVVLGDGSKGFVKEAPFDKIIVTAAAEYIPKQLLSQLKIGGIIVIPVGKFIQDMIKIKKTKNGFKKEQLGEFRFVPLIIEEE